MITKKDVQHIAGLARLGITKKEEEKFQKDLSSILNYIEKLKEPDVSRVKPSSHAVLLENATREDEPKPQSEETINKLIEAAPDKKDGFIKVKAVF